MNKNQMAHIEKNAAYLINRAIFVCALGYFIDVFDIQLLAVLRVPSLTELGIPADRITAIGGNLLSVQMFGMIAGAFLWGYLGDRFGRLKALYGSILLYSLGTLACSFVHDIYTYGGLRFITGFGLAGETGAAMTLIAELMPAAKRGWGMIIISAFGYLGPAAAVLISWVLDWRNTYITAGCLGLVLLVLRMRLAEPELFRKAIAYEGARSTARLLALPRQLLLVMYCLLIGFPFAYMWNLLNFFSPELSKTVLEPDAIFNQKICLLMFYTGASTGDIICGSLSQIWKSRKKATLAILSFGTFISAVYLLLGPAVKFSLPVFYTVYFFVGVAGGGWLMFSTIAAEHFGTNVRATTTLIVINCARGFAIPMILTFRWLAGDMAIPYAAATIGLVVYGGAFLALRGLRETHGLDLDYVT